MTTAARRPLASRVNPTLSSRFLRVPRDPMQWDLGRGWGVCFATCWNGQRTMLHSPADPCPNCGKMASNAVASMMAVRAVGARYFGNLYLPSKPTRYLHELPDIDWDEEYVVLTSRRRGSGSGMVDVEAEAVQRLSPSDPAIRRATEQHVRSQVLRHFQGELSDSQACSAILSWPMRGQLLG